MIYLTHCATTYTETPTLIDDIPYPQHAHIIQSSFKRAKTGMVYPPHKVLESVLSPDIVDYVKQNPVSGKPLSLLRVIKDGWEQTGATIKILILNYTIK